MGHILKFLNILIFFIWKFIFIQKTYFFVLYVAYN